MEDESVHMIRESKRDSLRLRRQHQRKEVTDITRSITEIRITPDQISNIAQNLKKKSCITALDLHILKNALIDDPNNAITLLRTQGALRGLVRELTGHDVKKQCAAAGCLCNLALADDKACNTVARASSSYLITALGNFIPELVVVCAWTLGNLACSSPRVCELLISQGAVSKLCDLMQGNEEVQDAALYALVHFAYQLKDELREYHLRRILQDLSKIELTMSASHLLFILSCHKDFLQNENENLSQKVLLDFPRSMETHLFKCKSNVKNVFCCKLIFLLRVLANMDISIIYKALLDMLLENNVSVSICKILNAEKESSLRDSFLWLLGNLYNFNSDNKFFNTILQSK